jgi:hypothetical protein
MGREPHRSLAVIGDERMANGTKNVRMEFKDDQAFLELFA